MADKPGITTLEQLEEVRRVQAETKRIYSICYSERLENKATVKAGELVKAGAIGKVVQTVGLGPHRINLADPPRVVLRDASSTAASSATSRPTSSTSSSSSRAPRRRRWWPRRSANVNHPQHPGLEDFGDALVRGDGARGYIRVDWFTPDGLKTWGDGRLTILGTDGYIEIRKNIDLAGREGGNHLFLVDQKETRYVDCTDVALPYGSQPRGRRPQPDGDRDAAGALLPGHGAGPPGAGQRPEGAVQRLAARGLHAEAGSAEILMSCRFLPMSCGFFARAAGRAECDNRRHPGRSPSPFRLPFEEPAAHPRLRKRK